MVKSENVNKIIQHNILSGRKIPHSTSQPVIYKENNNYYLAVFVFFFNKEDIAAGKVDRPTIWAICDFETGEIIEERETRIIEFSDASYEVKYDVHTTGKIDTSREYYTEAFSILDEVRLKILNEKIFDYDKYQLYMKKILANIPNEYKRFYEELGQIEKMKTNDDENNKQILLDGIVIKKDIKIDDFMNTGHFMCKGDYKYTILKSAPNYIHLGNGLFNCRVYYFNNKLEKIELFPIIEGVNGPGYPDKEYQKIKMDYCIDVLKNLLGHPDVDTQEIVGWEIPDGTIGCYSILKGREIYTGGYIIIGFEE